MKLRIKSDSTHGVYTEYTYTRVDTNHNITLVEPRQSLTSYGKQELRGYDLLNYQRRKRSGELLPHTPFVQYRVAGASTGWYSLFSPTNGGSYTSGGSYTQFEDWIIPNENYVNAIETAGFDHAGMIQFAASQAYSKGQDSLTFLAELPKTIALFKNLGKRLLTLLSKGRIDKIWLEYRYGWRQIYFDLKDITEALQTIQEGRTRISEKQGTSKQWTESDSLIYDGSTHTVYGSYIDYITVGVRGSVVAELSNPGFHFNPIVSAWELCSYSFILDWFVNIGQALSAISFLTLSDAYSASYGYEVQITRLTTIDSITPKSNYSVEKEQTATCIGTYRVRQPTKVPSFPRVNVRLDLAKILDLVALVSKRK